MSEIAGTDQPSQRPQPPLQLFYSYAHEDELLRDELATHLALLKRQNLIQPWHDRRISAGGNWAHDIDENLKSAHIILLLVSADFIASDYCYGIEMKEALRRHDAGEARVIPVILRPVDTVDAPFAGLQALPLDAVPVSQWPSADAAFKSVAEGIRRAVQELTASSDGRSAPLSFQGGTGEKARRAGWAVVGAVVCVVLLLAAAVIDHGRVSTRLAAASAGMDMGEYRRAGEFFQQAEADSWFPWLWSGIASGLEKTIRLEALRQDVSTRNRHVREYLERLLRDDPQDPHRHVLMGEYLIDVEQYDDALETLSNAVSRREALPQAHFDLGLAECLRGTCGEAIKHYERALELAPNRAEYRLNLAHALRMTGDRARANRILNTPMEDNLIIAYMDLARLLLDAQASDPQAALDIHLRGTRMLFDEAIVKLPKNQQAWFFETNAGRIVVDTLTQQRCYAVIALNDIYQRLGQQSRHSEFDESACKDPGVDAGRIRSWIEANRASASSQ